MFFIVPEGNKNKSARGVLDEIETFLIQSGKLKNPEILNKQKTKAPKWSIAGVVRSSKGKATKVSTDFRKLMGL